MFPYPAYAQRRRQQRPTPAVNDLEALADDLEYQASRARLAARRQSAPVPRPLVRRPSYGPYGPQSYDFEEQYEQPYSHWQPVRSHERAPNSVRIADSWVTQTYQQPQRRPQFVEEEFYEPPFEPEFDASYDYQPEYQEPEFDYAPRRPQPRARPALIRPAPARAYSRPAPEQRPREANEARLQAYLAKRYEEQEAAKFEREAELERARVEREEKAERNRIAAQFARQRGVQAKAQQRALLEAHAAEQQAQHHSEVPAELEALISTLSALGLNVAQRPEVPQPRPQPQPQPQPQQERPELELLRQLGLIPASEPQPTPAARPVSLFPVSWLGSPAANRQNRHLRARPTVQAAQPQRLQRRVAPTLKSQPLPRPPPLRLLPFPKKS